jgi:hypothetical protein
MTGMGITYPTTTPFVIPGFLADFTAGFRCPDFSMTRSDGESIFFYQLFEYGKYLVLLGPSAVLELLVTFREHVLTWNVYPLDDGVDGFSVVMVDGTVLTTTFDLGGENLAIIIRPDLYVGYAGQDPSEYFRGITLNSV